MKAEIEAGSASARRTTTGSPRSWGPGSPASASCACGLHVNEDHLLLEVVDPASGEPLEYGEQGELVITTLTKEAFPLLRYRTHDLTALDPSRCECGRTLVRMEKVRQRTDDMLIIRGVNVFPSQIEDVLFRIEGVRPHYLIVVDRKKNLDDLEVRIEVEEDVFSDVMADMVAFQRVGRRQAPVGPWPAGPGHARGAGRHRADRREGKAGPGPARRSVETRRRRPAPLAPVGLTPVSRGSRAGTARRGTPGASPASWPLSGGCARA